MNLQSAVYLSFICSSHQETCLRNKLSLVQSPTVEAYWPSWDQVPTPDQSVAPSAEPWPTVQWAHLWGGHRCLDQPWTPLSWSLAADLWPLSGGLALTSRSAFSSLVGKPKGQLVRYQNVWSVEMQKMGACWAGGRLDVCWGNQTLRPPRTWALTLLFFWNPLWFLSFHYDCSSPRT